MTEIAAAMGLTNLENLDDFVASNRRNYYLYRDAIGRIPGLSILSYDESAENNYQYIVLEVSSSFPLSRDRIVEILHAENVLARRYFWPGCHNMQPYRSYYPHAGLVLENTRRVADSVIVIPTGPTLGEADIRGIVAVLEMLASNGAAT
jgi:dTDP-4-amino-4,6-dideoxygalactose transaminase